MAKLRAQRLITCSRCERERPHDARGMCHACVEYLRRHGQLTPLIRWTFDPQATGGSYVFGDSRLPERFWAKVAIDDTGCWLWTGSLYRGYGSVKLPGLSSWAHRSIYQALVGPLAPSVTLDHLCHTADESCVAADMCRHRACCLPAHLEPVSLADNIARGRGNGSKTHCPQDHEYTADNIIWGSTGGRHCRKCVYIRNAARKARIRAANQGAQ